jgi:membrane protein
MRAGKAKRSYSRKDLAIHLTERTLSEYFADRESQFAASISYHVLFSLFPLAIVVTAIFGIVSSLTGVRGSAIDSIINALPLSASGASSVRHLLEGATGSYSSLGLIAILGLIWGASGMMNAIRSALDAAWDVTQARPYLKGKLIDVGLVFLAALGAIVSLGLTIAVRVIADQSRLLGSVLATGWAQVLLGIVVPLAYAFLLAFILYRLIPAARVESRFAWPPALGVACVYVLAQNLFALYVSHFGHYNAVYGSLGAAVAFMFFVYLASSIFLLGAELTSEWPRARTAFEQGTVEPGPPFRVQVEQFVRGLWVSEHRAESRKEEEGDGELRQQSEPRRSCRRRGSGPQE